MTSHTTLLIAQIYYCAGIELFQNPCTYVSFFDQNLCHPDQLVSARGISLSITIDNRVVSPTTLRLRLLENVDRWLVQDGTHYHALLLFDANVWAGVNQLPYWLYADRYSQACHPVVPFGFLFLGRRERQRFAAIYQ